MRRSDLTQGGKFLGETYNIGFTDSTSRILKSIIQSSASYVGITLHGQPPILYPILIPVKVKIEKIVFSLFLVSLSVWIIWVNWAEDPHGLVLVSNTTLLIVYPQVHTLFLSPNDLIHVILIHEQQSYFSFLVDQFIPRTENNGFFIFASLGCGLMVELLIRAKWLIGVAGRLKSGCCIDDIENIEWSIAPVSNWSEGSSSILRRISLR